VGTSVSKELFDRQGFPIRVGPAAYLAVATASQTASSIVQQGVAVLAVFVRAAEHLSLSQMGLVTSAMSLGVVAGMVLGGPQVDRRGPRAVLGVGTVWTALMATILAVTRGFPMLLGGLLLLGVGIAAYPASGTRAIFDAFTGRRRGFVMGIRQTGVPLGAALAAAVLPPLALYWGTSGIFLADALVLLAGGLPFALMMPPGRTTAGGAPPGRSWRELRGAAGPLAAAALLVAGQYVALAFTITDLHRVHGWTLAAAGIGLALVQVGGGVGRIGLGWWSDRRGGRRPPAILLAAAIGAAGAFVLGLLPRDVPGIVLGLVLFLFGIGAVGWNGLTLTWAGERVPSTRSGQAMSLTGSVVFLGSAVYPPLFGWVVDVSGQFRLAWWLLAALLAVAMGLVAALNRSDREPKAAAAS
jgi:MFS family permease